MSSIVGLGLFRSAGTELFTSFPMIDAAAVRISAGELGTKVFAEPSPVQAAMETIKGMMQSTRSIP